MEKQLADLPQVFGKNVVSSNDHSAVANWPAPVHTSDIRSNRFRRSSNVRRVHFASNETRLDEKFRNVG